MKALVILLATLGLSLSAYAHKGEHGKDSKKKQHKSHAQKKADNKKAAAKEKMTEDEEMPEEEYMDDEEM